MAERSEWGKLNAGQVYGILAVDVDRAIACADLGKHQQVLLQAVRERSWGTSARRKRRGEPWPEPEPARINLKALAEELGVAWQHLYAARKWLLDARMIVSTDGGLMPNKNACEWANPRTGEPLLSIQAVAYAARACTRHDGQINPPTFTGNHEEIHREVGTPDSQPSVNGVHREVGTPFTAKCERRSQGSVNGSHYIEPARNSDPTGLDSPRVDVCETGDHTHTDPIRSTPQRPTEDLAHVSEAARILAGQLDTQHLGTELLRQQNLPDLVALEGWRWVLAANRVQSSAVPAAKRRSWHYLVAVARNLTEADRFAAAAGIGPLAPGNGRLPAMSLADQAAALKAGRERLLAERAARANGSHGGPR